ncbi:hypothetical protein [Polaromonas jejuensis]|uniref:Uncharacterized protein n=1 Tax=Polaromonas jejuensis TaxID=457502 RepID=A0ABW0QK81_9BURK|nr:hypothetical protein [Polaromonas jejuensis]
MKPIICSGLGIEPCPKRDECTHYAHWTVDPRSQFNACSDSGQLKHFISTGTPKPATPQQELFA